MSSLSSHSRSDASWQNPRVLSALLAVFLTGAAFGAVVMKLTYRSQGVATAGTAAPSWKNEDSKVVLSLFKRELNLTDKQSADMEIVLDDFSMYLQNLQGQLEDVRQDGRQRIMKILTAEQQEKFKRVVAPILARPLK